MSSSNHPSADERPYDDETYSKATRITGAFQAIAALVSRLEVMPCDVATARLRGALEFVAQQAVLSAWEYAKQYAPKDDAT